MGIQIRTLHTSAEGVVRLLQALTAGDVRIVQDGIPRGATVAACRATNAHEFEIDIVAHDWPDNIDPTSPIELLYACKYSDTGAATDWSAPIGIGTD